MDKSYGRKIIKRNKRTKFITNCILWLIGISIGSLMISGIIHIFCCRCVTKVEATEVKPVAQSCEEVVMGCEEPEFVPLDVPLNEDVQEFIYDLCCDNEIDFPFVMALIETESSFNVNAISGTNDYGLMQINKINHEWLKSTLGVTNFCDPYQNTKAGIFMLKNLFEKYEDPSKVLMAYNMGESGAKKLWKQGIFESNYSKKIMKQAAEYKEIYTVKEGENYDKM